MIAMLDLVDVPSLGVERGVVVGRTFARVTHVDVMDRRGIVHANVAVERASIQAETQDAREARLAKDYSDTTTVMEDYND